jgi:hypothetical protein
MPFNDQRMVPILIDDMGKLISGPLHRCRPAQKGQAKTGQSREGKPALAAFGHFQFHISWTPQLAMSPFKTPRPSASTSSCL